VSAPSGPIPARRPGSSESEYPVVGATRRRRARSRPVDPDRPGRSSARRAAQRRCAPSARPSLGSGRQPRLAARSEEQSATPFPSSSRASLPASARTARPAAARAARRWAAVECPGPPGPGPALPAPAPHAGPGAHSGPEPGRARAGTDRSSGGCQPDRPEPGRGAAAAAPDAACVLPPRAPARARARAARLLTQTVSPSCRGAGCCQTRVFYAAAGAAAGGGASRGARGGAPGAACHRVRGGTGAALRRGLDSDSGRPRVPSARAAHWAQPARARTVTHPQASTQHSWVGWRAGAAPSLVRPTRSHSHRRSFRRPAAAAAGPPPGRVGNEFSTHGQCSRREISVELRLGVRCCSNQLRVEAGSKVLLVSEPGWDGGSG
jgi:hypothetical protein